MANFLRKFVEKSRSKSRSKSPVKRPTRPQTNHVDPEFEQWIHPGDHRPPSYPQQRMPPMIRVIRHLSPGFLSSATFESFASPCNFLNQTKNNSCKKLKCRGA